MNRKNKNGYSIFEVLVVFTIAMACILFIRMASKELLFKAKSMGIYEVILSVILSEKEQVIQTINNEKLTFTRDEEAKLYKVQTKNKNTIELLKSCKLCQEAENNDGNCIFICQSEDVNI